MLDHTPARRRVLLAIVPLAVVALARPSTSRAQLPGLPAAQSAFPAPGLAVAVDGGRADGRTVAGLALATGVRRLQLTAAAAIPGAFDGYTRKGISAGARLAGRLYRTPRLGVSAFAGIGAERMHSTGVLPSYALGSGGTTNVRYDGSLTQVPVGVSAGLRGVLGTRAYALSVAPMYEYMRWKFADSVTSRSGARLAALAELAITPRIGIGVAAEVGSGGPAGSPYGSSRTIIGAGLSYAIHRVVAR